LRTTVPEIRERALQLRELALEVRAAQIELPQPAR
jgi:hypothetical protein